MITKTLTSYRLVKGASADFASTSFTSLVVLPTEPSAPWLVPRLPLPSAPVNMASWSWASMRMPALASSGVLLPSPLALPVVSDAMSRFAIPSSGARPR